MFRSAMNFFTGTKSPAPSLQDHVDVLTGDKIENGVLIRINPNLLGLKIMELADIQPDDKIPHDVLLSHIQEILTDCENGEKARLVRNRFVKAEPNEILQESKEDDGEVLEEKSTIEILEVLNAPLQRAAFLAKTAGKDISDVVAKIDAQIDRLTAKEIAPLVPEMKALEQKLSTTLNPSSINQLHRDCKRIYSVISRIENLTGKNSTQPQKLELKNTTSEINSLKSRIQILSKKLYTLEESRQNTPTKGVNVHADSIARTRLGKR